MQTRVLLVGYGKMGQAIARLAPDYGVEIAGIVDPHHPDHGGRLDDPAWASVDVAIDFTSPEAVVGNVTALAAQKLNVVLGTTGWAQHEETLRQAVARAGIGIVAAPNYSTGVVLFDAVVAQAAALFASQSDFGAWLHEAHHAMKKDAPSGTALKLKRSMEEAGYDRPIDVSATRVGHVPGTHTIGFDGPSESITLTHTARDRAVFARGALQAARWLHGRRGWFDMKDVLGLRS